MSANSLISPEKKAIAIHLRERGKWLLREIGKQWKIANPLCCPLLPLQEKGKQSLRPKGRPRKLSGRGCKVVIKTLKKMRTKENFSIKKLVVESGLTLASASERTFSQVLNERGYFFVNAYKKGL